MARPSKQEQEERLKSRKAERDKKNQGNTNNKAPEEETITSDSKEYEGMGFGNETEPKKENFKIEENSTPTVDPFLSAKTTEKPYAKDNATIIGNVPNSVPEEVIEAPIINVSAGAGTNEKKFEPGEVKNPQWDDMSKKEQTMGSEFIAENVLSMYEGANELVKNAVSFDEQKYMQKALKGEFDMDVLDLELPITEDGSQTIHVRKVLEDTNETAENVFTVSEKFKEQVRPLLTHIFKEKGWGLSPTHQLIYLFGKDALPKIYAMIEIRKTQKEFLNIATQVLSQYKQINQKQATAAQNIAASQAASQGTPEAQAQVVTMTVEKPAPEEPENNEDFPVSEDTEETVIIQDNSSELASEMNAALNLGKNKKRNKGKGKKTNAGKKGADMINGAEPGE